MNNFFTAFIAPVIGLSIRVPVVLGILKPGLYFLWSKLGARALIVNLFGQCHVLDMRMDLPNCIASPTTV